MNRNLKKILARSNIAIVSHIFATGPALDLEVFLMDKVKNLIFIGHPFSYRRDRNSYYRSYHKGYLVKQYKAWDIKLPDVFTYLKDAFYTFFWILLNGKKYDIYIGSDNYMAFLGILLKRLGRVDEVILYTIDFMQNRFKNPVLNYLYHYFDRQCLKNCKKVWNLSDAMALGREKYENLRRSDYKNQMTVPVGIWHKRIPKLPFDKRKRYQLVFMGHLIEKQGLDLVIKSLPKLIKKFPKLNLLIIGTGAYEKDLKHLVKKLGIEKFIQFTGYVEDHKDVEKMLSESMLAIAMYKPDPDSFTYFADPGKIKNYLSAGLPIILSNVPPIAKDIERRRCGSISAYGEEDFVRKVATTLSDNKMLNSMITNAVSFAKQFDYEKIFKSALEKSLS